MQFPGSISRGAGRRSGLVRGGVWLVLILLLAGTALAQTDGDDEMPAPKRTGRKKAPKAEAATEVDAPQQDAPKREPAARPSTKKTETRKGGAGPATASEGTSSEHPDWPLALWSDGPAVAWRGQAYGCAQQVEKLLAQLEKTTGKTAAKKRVAAIGNTYVLLIEMERHIARLRTWTEPAAEDLGLRLKALRTRLNPIVEDVRSNNSQLMYDIQLALRERCQKAEKQLAAIKKLRDAGKSEVAETRLLKLYDELAPDGVWYSQAGSSSPFYPFVVLLQGLADDLAPERQQAAHDAMKQYRDEQKPNYAALLAEVGAATANIAAGRPVKVGGKTLDGPQSVEAFLARWPELHFRMLHAGAMESALANFNVLPPESADTQSYRKFEQDLTAALVKLIDAEPAQGDQVAQRHAAYLRALAPTLSLAADDAWAPQFQAALDRLAAKSPSLAAELDSYRRATSDILRWRARLAAAQRARAEPRAAVVTGFQGTLSAPAAELLQGLSAKLQGGATVGADLIGASATGLAESGLADDQTYYVVALDGRLEQAARSLRAALLATGSTEPLSLEAAIALARAERGDLAAVGGTVKRIQLESFVADSAHADHWGLARLGRAPKLRRAEALQARIELEPRWYQQTYAFIPAVGR